MKKIAAALAAPLLLTACDIKESITGKPSSAPAEYTQPGSFWDSPVSAPMQTADISDYNQPAATKPMTTSAASDYYTTASVSDYEQPAAPAPIAAEDGGQDDVLMVPARAAAPAVQAVQQKENLIVVASGDTLYSLSRKHNVPLRDLITANKLEPPYAISPGKTLFLPNSFAHVVAKGETLYSISRMYQMDLNSLAQMNNLQAPYSLSVGQKLALPAQIQLTNNSPLVGESAAPPQVGGQKEEEKKPEIKIETQPVVVKKPTNVGSLPKTPARAGSKFGWPLRGVVLSGFGAKSNGLYNDGINIKASRGDPVSAADNGVVAYAGNEIKGLGNLVIIKHADNYMSVYAHLDTILVERGKVVAKGAKIGSAGMTGKVSSPQLHFEIRQGTRALNPISYLTK